MPLDTTTGNPKNGAVANSNAVLAFYLSFANPTTTSP